MTSNGDVRFLTPAGVLRGPQRHTGMNFPETPTRAQAQAQPPAGRIWACATGVGVCTTALILSIACGLLYLPQVVQGQCDTSATALVTEIYPECEARVQYTLVYEPDVTYHPVVNTGCRSLRVGGYVDIQFMREDPVVAYTDCTIELPYEQVRDLHRSGRRLLVFGILSAAVSSLTFSLSQLTQRRAGIERSEASLMA